MIFSLFFFFKRRGRLRDSCKAGQNQGKGGLQQYISERNHIPLLHKSQDSLKTLLITSGRLAEAFLLDQPLEAPGRMAIS